MASDKVYLCRQTDLDLLRGGWKQAIDLAVAVCRKLSRAQGGAADRRHSPDIIGLRARPTAR